MQSLIDDRTVEEIKTALCRSETFAEVNNTAQHFARHVRELQNSKDRDQRTMAIQIKNLAGYRRHCIRYGE